MIGGQAILALGVEKKFAQRPKLGALGKFEKILKHFRNFKPPHPLKAGNALFRGNKNFRRGGHHRQLRLGVRPIGLKISS